MITIRELFLKGKSLLNDFPQPALEAKILLLKCCSGEEEELLSSPDKKLTRREERGFYKLASKRRAGFPLAYLTGTKEFWSIPFRVFSGVLIPRPETELIVEKVLELNQAPAPEPETIVDIGTGCGNIAISLAKELPQARIFATDNSRKALTVARLNSSLLETDNITFAVGSLFSPLRRFKLEKKCDFIVSNPPYVSEQEWEELAEEIKNHEPKKALVPGETGLEIIKDLIKGSPRFLKAGGYLVFEIGEGQKKRVLSLFNSNWRKVSCFNDLNGIPRVVVARKI
ncbi:MAG: peptide chain release factor N(5)-glutamine methyltransferase [Candidatus Aminicenantaceae bacterium]